MQVPASAASSTAERVEKSMRCEFACKALKTPSTLPLRAPQRLKQMPDGSFPDATEQRAQFTQCQKLHQDDGSLREGKTYALVSFRCRSAAH